MQGIIDATCRDCDQIIRWDTAMPRLCADCLDALRKPAEPKPKPETEPDPTPQAA